MEKQDTLESVAIAHRQPSADGEKPQVHIENPDALSKDNGHSQGNGHGEEQYITGFKLAIVMVSLTLVFFLVMLDLSIIATVSQALLCYLNLCLDFIDGWNRLYLVSQVTFILCLMWAGTAAPIFWPSVFFSCLSNIPRLLPTKRRTSCSLQPLTGKLYTNFNSKVICTTKHE